MVVSEPMAISYTFAPNMTVTTKMASSVHLGPGNNYAFLATIPTGTSGTVLPQLTHLNGVLAKGSFWWKVSMGGIEGWIREENLVGGKIPSSYYKIFLPTINNIGSASLRLDTTDVHSPFPSVIENPMVPLNEKLELK
jgi:hypothetical protein